MTTIEKILFDYDSGTITKRERLVALARLITPETVPVTLANIPPDIVRELLSWARVKPTAGGVMIGAELPEEEARKFAAQLQIAAQTLREWDEANESQGGVLASQPSRNGISGVS